MTQTVIYADQMIEGRKAYLEQIIKALQAHPDYFSAGCQAEVRAIRAEISGLVFALVAIEAETHQ